MSSVKVEPMSKIPPEWRPAEKYIAVCARCGSEVLKQNAVAIYKKRSHENMSLLFHHCMKCHSNFLDDYGIGE